MILRVDDDDDADAALVLFVLVLLLLLIFVLRLMYSWIIILSFPAAISAAAASCFRTVTPPPPGNIIPPTTPGGSPGRVTTPPGGSRIAAFVLPGSGIVVAVAAVKLFNFGLIKRYTISRQTAYCCVGTNTSGVIPVPWRTAEQYSVRRLPGSKSAFGRPGLA